VIGAEIEVRYRYRETWARPVRCSVYVLTGWGDAVWATWSSTTREASDPEWLADALARARRFVEEHEAEHKHAG
jgi:hypothetical protein